MVRFFILGFFFLSSCGGSALHEGVPQKPLVWVSIAPYQDFAERIVGTACEVKTIVPLGTSAHTFEPNARQIAEMGRGVVWFRIGEPFEGKILPILQERNHHLSVFDLREGMELISAEEEHGHICSRDHQDRHIWMSPLLAIQQARAMAQFLIVQFPEKRSYFLSNLERLEQDLSQLDQEIRSLLSGTHNRVLLVSHPAFGYFCRDYDCLQLSVESEGKDPRPRYLEELFHTAEKRASMAIAIPQYNNKGVQQMAHRLRVPVQVIDPYTPDYFGMMRQLAAWIAHPRDVER